VKGSQVLGNGTAALSPVRARGHRTGRFTANRQGILDLLRERHTIDGRRA